MRAQAAARSGVVALALVTCGCSDDREQHDTLVVSARLPKNRGCCQLYKVDEAGREWQLPLRGRDPAWSARSHRLVYTTQGQLWVGRLEGHRRRVVIGRYLAAVPKWAPDGRHVVFECALGRRRDRRTGVCVTDLSRGSVRRLLWESRNASTTVSYSQPSWSPHAADIAFVRAVDDRHRSFVAIAVFRIDPRTRHVQRLTRDTPQLASTLPTWAPDGNTIAYYRADYSQAPDAECTIRSVRRDGKGEKQLLPPVRGVKSCSVTALTWSPDGSRFGLSVSGDYCFIAQIRHSPHASVVNKRHLGCSGLTWVGATKPAH